MKNGVSKMANSIVTENEDPASKAKAVTVGIEASGEMCIKDLDIDELSAEIATLAANLQLINGEGVTNFTSMNDEIKSDFIWGMSRSAERCKDMIANVRLVRLPEEPART
jgi:hypothetical protein